MSNSKLSACWFVWVNLCYRGGLTGLREHARLVRGNHVFDINKGVFPTMSFEALQSFMNKLAQIVILLLRVVDLVADVLVAILEDVEDGQQLF